VKFKNAGTCGEDTLQLPGGTGMPGIDTSQFVRILIVSKGEI
jgi:hypothetical protein